MRKSMMFMVFMIFLISLVHAQKEWTVMVFMNGDNNLESAGIKDLNEMEMIGSTKDVDVVVQYDRCEGYDNSNGNWTDTRIFHVEKDNDVNKINSPVVKELGEVDMGSYKEAIKFFDWSVKNYPARRYMFVYWNHGAGWLKAQEEKEAIVKGISYDDESGNHIDSVGMKKVAEAMYSTLGRKLDIIAFDACLMGMIEVARQQSDYVDYMIASEEIEPGDGWPYDSVLEFLTYKPSISTVSFGVHVVNEYAKSYKKSDGYWGVTSITQACLNLSKTESLEAAVDRFSEVLFKNMSSEFKSIVAAKNCGQDYKYQYFIDLYDFCKIVYKETSNPEVKSRAKDVMIAVDKMVVMYKNQGNTLNSHGISIYLPRDKYEFSPRYIYTDFAKNTGWDEMIKRTFTNYTFVSDTNAEITSENYDEKEIVLTEVEKQINKIQDLLKSSEFSNDQEKYAEIDAWSATLAKTVMFNKIAGNDAPYKKLMNSIKLNPALSVVMEKVK